MQPKAETNFEKPQSYTIEGFLLDVDYLNKNERSIIRLTVRGYDGNSYEIFDEEFKPYFCFVPGMEMSIEEMQKIFVNDVKSRIEVEKVEREQRSLFGESVDCYKIFVSSAAYVPKLSEVFSRHGRCYENDIPFARRYVIDNDITQLSKVLFEIKNDNNTLFLKGSKPAALSATAPNLNILCFDIEVYNPLAIPRPELDPVIMISYYYVVNGKNGSGVITYKQIDEKFVTVAKDEIGMLQEFTNLVNSLDIDVLIGYNSANFDMRYLIERAKVLKFDFNLSRFEGNTSIEHHGLVDKVKIAGRVHVDMYLVVKFIAIVGSAEYILKLNSYTLKNVYEAIAKEKKVMVDKNAIHMLWNGSMEEKRNLAVYNLNDSEALYKVYSTLIPTMIELSRITGNTLGDVCVSTTGQLVEFMLMKHAHMFDELIPNKPNESEIRSRLLNPIEGAYVKTPDPGIYGNIACFDFRGLYPSLIRSYNIDPSSICKDCKEYYESPIGVRFSKTRKSIMPTILKRLVDERVSVKALYKKDMSNIYWGARSQALKITANAFSGYLGYARSRWYSRECAASVTAYGRQYIQKTINDAESNGFKVIYGDTDSIILLLGDNTKEHAVSFLKAFNESLPKNMELELEDFYKRGVFVGKRVQNAKESGAKKKYALITEDGRIKIRGFELVRRDWSKIARDTQRKVLETILQEGDAQKAVNVVNDVVKRLREGKVPLSELAISTQLRKLTKNYDAKSPELGAAQKAIQQGLKRSDEIEHSVISYVITKHGNSISDKAVLEEFAKDYDPDYYINNQVIPATMRILKELNFNEDELKGAGKQSKLL